MPRTYVLIAFPGIPTVIGATRREAFGLFRELAARGDGVTIVAIYTDPHGYALRQRLLARRDPS